MNKSAEMPSLENMNSAEIKRLIPTVVFMLVICVVGTIGNCLVIHVYRTRFKMSNSKCFIMCLCAVDLFTCCIAIPLEIATILNQYTFNNQWLCKATRVSNTLGTTSSSFILLFIAVERFRKVCKPFGWQIQIQMTKYMCGLAICLGIMISWPSVFIFGKHTFDIPQYNMTGTECSTADEVGHTKFPFAYALVFGIFFIGGITEMSVLYCLIGFKVRRQARKMNEIGTKTPAPAPSTSNVINNSKVKDVNNLLTSETYVFTISKDENNQNEKSSELKKDNENSESLTEKQDTEQSITFNMNRKKSRENLDCTENVKDLRVTEDDVSTDLNVTDKRETNKLERHEHSSTFNKDMAEIAISVPEHANEDSNAKERANEEYPHCTYLRRLSSLMSSQVSDVMLRLKLGRKYSTSKTETVSKKSQFWKQARARKTSFLMFVVTLGFIVSFLPHLLLMLIRQIKKDFTHELSDTNKAVYKFFLRSYLLNCAINPVIYSILDSRFKSACKNMLKSCVRRSHV